MSCHKRGREAHDRAAVANRPGYSEGIAWRDSHPSDEQGRLEIRFEDCSRPNCRRAGHTTSRAVYIATRVRDVMLGAGTTPSGSRELECKAPLFACDRSSDVIVIEEQRCWIH